MAAHLILQTMTMIGKGPKVVYQAPCSCGKAYVGETVRRLETRMKEHRDACQKGALEKSALAEHAWESHHPIKWEETTVVDQARTPKELLLKEAIHIRLLKPPLNRDGGLELPGCWMAALGAGKQRWPAASGGALPRHRESENLVVGSTQGLRPVAQEDQGMQAGKWQAKTVAVILVLSLPYNASHWISYI